MKMSQDLQRQRETFEVTAFSFIIIGGFANIYSLYLQFILNERSFNHFLDIEIAGIVACVFGFLLVAYSVILGPHSS